MTALTTVYLLSYSSLRMTAYRRVTQTNRVVYSRDGTLSIHSCKHVSFPCGCEQTEHMESHPASTFITAEMYYFIRRLETITL